MDYALSVHPAGTTSSHQDVNVGVCWDADRCCLWRCGIEPDPSLLSTQAGVDAIAYGREVCERPSLPSWAEIEGGVLTPT